MTRKTEDALGIILGLAAVFGFSLAIAIAHHQYDAAMRDLMDACMKDRQRYECVAMLSH